MTGQGGEWTVNSHLFCFCTFNWAFGNGIINMQLQSPRECAGEVRPCVRVCLFGVCESARMCESLLICVPWVSRGHSSPLCAEWEETRGPSRHEITDYTLNASPRGLNRAQESKIEGERGKKGKKKKGGTREGDDERKTNKRVNGVNCKGARGSGLHWRETVMRKSAFVRANGRDGAKKKMRARQRPNAIVLFLSGRQSDFIARSFTMSSWGFSAPVMTIANLCKDMDYTRAKLATKHSIIHILYPAWPHFLENCIDKSLS